MTSEEKRLRDNAFWAVYMYDVVGDPNLPLQASGFFALTRVMAHDVTVAPRHRRWSAATHGQSSHRHSPG